MTRRYLALDETLPDGRSIHELIADPRTVDDPPDESRDGEPLGSDAEPDAISAEHSLIAGVARVRDLERRATAAESDALALRDQANREAARLIALADALTQAIAAEDLLALSAQQLAIARTRIELIGEGEDPTHHAVARRLGITHAAVSKQWSRVLTKLAAGQGRDVSTPAA